MFCLESALVNYVNDEKNTVSASILRRAPAHLQHVSGQHASFCGMMACHSEFTEPNNLSGAVIQTDCETGFSFAFAV